MERYDLLGEYDCSIGRMEQGDYVRYKEAQSAIEAERQKNTFLRIDLDQVRVDILERDATIHKLMDVPIDKIEALTHGLNCPARTPTKKDECNCGLYYRQLLRTEQEMHSAWRKRATEAEDQLHESNEALVARDALIEKAFLAHPNLDLDIEYLLKGEK